METASTVHAGSNFFDGFNGSVNFFFSIKVTQTEANNPPGESAERAVGLRGAVQAGAAEIP